MTRRTKPSRFIDACWGTPKPLRWTSPAGVPFINQYNKPFTKTVKLWLHNRGIRVRYATRLVAAELPKIDKKEAVKGAAPNFVHACDAAHLMLTVNAAVTEGITSIVTVHDSFGCLASRAERFRKIIREQFVRMYEEHNVLAEVLKQTRESLSEPNAKHPLPALPPKGALDLKQALDAEFAFA
jgi:DNA-directed RNA polymerase, mitochondrial